MDTFRRLRSRRKSKEKADSFTSYADAESNYNKSGSSPWQSATARSSATASRPSDTEKKISHDQLRQPASPITPHRPSPLVTRIQPLLVGITSPTNSSRPVTAGSLQHALDRAADNITSQSRATRSPASQVGLRTGRYIDIFAISRQSTKPTTTFNEDVAERNLDTIALTIEEQHYRYEPSSKYQEEVAARNVPHALSSKPYRQPRESSLSPPPNAHSHNVHLQPESPSVGHEQDPLTYHPRQKVSRVKDASEYLPVIPQEQPSDDLRSDMSMSRSRAQKTDLEAERAKARWLEARRRNLANSSSITEKPLPASPYRRDLVSERNTPLRSNPVSQDLDAPESQPNKTLESTQTSMTPSDHSQAQQPQKYRQESLQNNTYRPNRASANTAITNSSEESRARSDVSGGQNDRRSYTSDMSRRTQQRRPSAASTTSYKRQVIGNRFIMDLTAEDEAEATPSVASYLQTPVIEHARADSFQKAYPTIVDHQSPPQIVVERDPVVPNSRWSSALEPVLDLDQLARRSQIISETAKAAAAARSQAKQAEAPRATTAPSSTLAFSPIQTMSGSSPRGAITFSTISTLTSITPRSSHEILVTDQMESPVENGSSSQEALKGALAIPPLDKASEKSSVRKSANIAPLVRVFADVQPQPQPQPQEEEVVGVIEKPRPIRTDSGSQKPQVDPAEALRRSERRREKMARAESIRAAAKLRIPAGPLDQEPLPGVKTRDFAVAPPMEKPTNKRIEALSERKRSQPDLRKPSSSPSRASASDKKSRGKTSKVVGKVTFDEVPVANLPIQPEKKSGKKVMKSGASTSKRTRPISVFDEEAFQKKHAEANAALLRLQHSLQQGLDDEDDASQFENSRDVETPVSRGFSPASSVAHGKSPVARSPSAVAIAMITAATSSPRLQARPKLSRSDSSQDTMTPSIASRRATEENLPTIRTTQLTRPAADNLAPFHSGSYSSKPPPSPGEVSLSSFPIPTPRTMSPESNKSPPAYVKDVDGPVRRSSQSSRVSTASTFSIPFTMVPNRLGSLPEYRAPPGPPNPHQMQSIDAIIPPAHIIHSL